MLTREAQFGELTKMIIFHDCIQGTEKLLASQGFIHTHIHCNLLNKPRNE